MNCPICGNELKPSKKDPNYALCHNCRKKFKLPKAVKKPAPDTNTSVEDDELTEQTQVFSRREIRAAIKKANAERIAEKKAAKAASQKAGSSAPAASSSEEEDGEYHFRYANLPPKEVRAKQEREMRRAYDELLSIGEEERSSKKHGLFSRRR